MYKIIQNPEFAKALIGIILEHLGIFYGMVVVFVCKYSVRLTNKIVNIKMKSGTYFFQGVY